MIEGERRELVATVAEAPAGLREVAFTLEGNSLRLSNVRTVIDTKRYARGHSSMGQKLHVKECRWLAGGWF